MVPQITLGTGKLADAVAAWNDQNQHGYRINEENLHKSHTVTDEKSTNRFTNDKLIIDWQQGRQHKWSTVVKCGTHETRYNDDLKKECAEAGAPVREALAEEELRNW